MAILIIGICVFVFLFICSLLNQTNVRYEEPPKREGKKDDMSLDPGAEDWEYQCELLDIIDPDDEDF